MDFFADGGFQQLFCDLNEQLEQDYNNWQPQQFTNDRNNNKSNNKKVGCCLTTAYDENEANICLLDETLNNYSPQIMDLHEKELQTSLDYLLSNSRESLWEYESCLSSFSSVSKDLCDWEEKFLDNFIEIPELVDILPEKTPLCTDNCNHFLQESAKNLKLPAAVLNVNDVDVDADDKSYVCSFGDCHKVYAKPAHLKAHLRRHLGEKPYICDWPNCTWKFSRSDELARHRRSHSGVKPYKCDFCAKCFARSDHLTKHRKVHERRLLAASKAGKTLINGQLPASVLTVRPGRKKKNQL